MEEIKVNDYIRTYRGDIGKVKKVTTTGVIIQSDRHIHFDMIADNGEELIEVVGKDDYVNGYLIVETHKDPFNGKKIASTEIMKIDCWGDRYLVQFHNEDIESVATKEQFNSIKYVIGE